MSSFLILALLIGLPVWAVFQAFRLRDVIDDRHRTVDPVTGALFFEVQREARRGMSDLEQRRHLQGIEH